MDKSNEETVPSIEYVLIMDRTDDDTKVFGLTPVRQIDGKKYIASYTGPYEFGKKYGKIAEGLAKQVIINEKLTDETVDISIKIRERALGLK